MKVFEEDFQGTFGDMRFTANELGSIGRAGKIKPGLLALARSEEALAPGATSWVIKIATEGKHTGAQMSCYPTRVYGGITLTRRYEFAMRFGTEGDAREAGYLLRDDEDMFDMFDAVPCC